MAKGRNDSRCAFSFCVFASLRLCAFASLRLCVLLLFPDQDIPPSARLRTHPEAAAHQQLDRAAGFLACVGSELQQLDLIGPGQVLDFKADGLDYWNYGVPTDKYPYDTRRLRRVLEIAAERAGWGKRSRARGRGMGIVASRSFTCYVASVVEVEVDGQGAVRGLVGDRQAPGREGDASFARRELHGAREARGVAHEIDDEVRAPAQREALGHELEEA